mmetsp:Transcript_145630/g.254207  ORF Transcript_145630/g.254207 Transcript_145630/m.254207 type:complete len:301 (-) Transcript_145630:1959-2861(-)
MQPQRLPNHDVCHLLPALGQHVEVHESLSEHLASSERGVRLQGKLQAVGGEDLALNRNGTDAEPEGLIPIRLQGLLLDLGLLGLAADGQGDQRVHVSFWIQPGGLNDSQLKLSFLAPLGRWAPQVRYCWTRCVWCQGPLEHAVLDDWGLGRIGVCLPIHFKGNGAGQGRKLGCSRGAEVVHGERWFTRTAHHQPWHRVELLVFNLCAADLDCLYSQMPRQPHGCQALVDTETETMELRAAILRMDRSVDQCVGADGQFQPEENLVVGARFLELVCEEHQSSVCVQRHLPPATGRLSLPSP